MKIFRDHLLASLLVFMLHVSASCIVNKVVSHQGGNAGVNGTANVQPSILRPAGGVKRSDSDLVETGVLSAKKALR